jgi:hypothetical protein
VALGWLDPHIVGQYQLELANDVFNGVGTFGLIILPRCARSAAWRRAVLSHVTIVVPGEWSIGLTLHYSCTVATYPHFLKALTTLPAHTSYRPVMVMTSGIFETCTRELETRGPSRTGRPARVFFMFEARGP